MEIKKLLEDAVPSKFFNLPPFYVETFTAGSCVFNKNSVNCLTFKSKPGAIFTSLDEANAIANHWNKEVHHG